MRLSVFIVLLCFIFTSCAVTGNNHRYTGTKHNNKGAVRIVKKLNNQLLNSGIIYGNIQIRYGLRDLELKKLGSTKTFNVRAFNNGNFIAENLTPGYYIISSIRTTKRSSKIVLFKNNIDFFSIYVGVAETVYAGSFKVQLVSSKKSVTKVTISRSIFPTEKQVLQHITHVETNTIWFDSLYFRMQSLI